MNYRSCVKDERAMISIDFLTGVGVLMIAFLFAVYTISNVMTPYSGYSKELYPNADRAASLLIEDEGYWSDGLNYGTEWNAVWETNQTFVKKIGFRDENSNDLIDSRKLDVFMIDYENQDNKTKWWEYPSNSTSTDPNELDNVSRALGLGRYNFYLHILPVNESLINVTEVNTAARDAIVGSGDVAAVTRLTLIKQTTHGNFDGYYLYGHENPAKVLIVIEPQYFDIIAQGIEFSISNWTFEGTNVTVSDFQWIKVGNETNSAYELPSTDKLLPNQYNLSINETEVSTENPLQFNNTDTLEFFIPRSTLDTCIPNWYSTGKKIYVQLNVMPIVNVRVDGQTYYSSTIKRIIYPVKMTLWTW
jgi:hypothetical protein